MQTEEPPRPPPAIALSCSNPQEEEQVRDLTKLSTIPSPRGISNIRMRQAKVAVCDDSEEEIWEPFRDHPYPQLKSDTRLNLDKNNIEALSRRLREMRTAHQRGIKAPTRDNREVILKQKQASNNLFNGVGARTKPSTTDGDRIDIKNHVINEFASFSARLTELKLNINK